tara:strand:+ start:6989 stop:7720 length:732 start_codon:yes stop_codon:yes gene_type:complete
MRLNRFLARAGIASRRKSDDLILQGAVVVNGLIVDELGSCVDPEYDRVEFAGEPVSLPDCCEYFLLNKPEGYVVTRCDTHNRPTVFDLVNGLRMGTMPVGRLDMATTGVLVWTDDGELAHRLLHPRYLIDKVYEAIVRGVPCKGTLTKLREGVDLADGRTAPAEVDIINTHGIGYRQTACVRLILHEGRKRQVRRMLRSVGHPVRALKRVAFAGLTLGDLNEGKTRGLSNIEIQDLRIQVGLA